MFEPPDARRARASGQRPEQLWQIEHEACTLDRSAVRMHGEIMRNPIGIARCGMSTRAEGAIWLKAPTGS
jgi:hypothetical protein